MTADCNYLENYHFLNNSESLMASFSKAGINKSDTARNHNFSFWKNPTPSTPWSIQTVFLSSISQELV